MKKVKWNQWALVGALAAAPGGAWAAPEPGDLSELKDQLRKQQQVIDQQQQRLGVLEHTENQTWLNEQRAEEVKGLVRQVLADADTRTSLGIGANAGYDKGFFIASSDNKFKLRINGDVQVRYLFNNRQGEAPATDQDENGFQLRQTRLDFQGFAFDPSLTYRVRLSADRATGNVNLDYAYLGYAFADKWLIKAGQIKPLFLREEAVNAFKQVAVERSYASDYFTVDLTQGAELTYDGGWWRPSLAIHDGSYAANTDYNADRTNLAVAGRVEFLAAGDWKQFEDFTSWSTDKFGLLLGVAGDYEIGETGGGTSTPDAFKYSADVSAEFGGASLFAAIYGQRFSDNGSSAGLPSQLGDANQLGLVIQGSVFAIPDKLELFGRYEWMDFDGAYYRNNGSATQGGTGNISADALSIITAGGTWYFRKHNAKFTLDALWASDAVPVANTSSGLLASNGKDQVVLRGQWQFAF